MAVGGQDLIFIKQKPSSTISSVELRGYLNDLGDNMYSDGNNPSLLDRKTRNGKQKVPDVFTRMLQPHTKQFTNITETSSKTEIAFTVMENGAATYALITNLNITETPSRKYHWIVDELRKEIWWSFLLYYNMIKLHYIIDP